MNASSRGTPAAVSPTIVTPIQVALTRSMQTSKLRQSAVGKSGGLMGKCSVSWNDDKRSWIAL